MSEDIEMMTKELPLNFGPLKGANANARITGPCGDTMEFWLKIDDKQILVATFTTDGCDNSIICGSTAGYMVQNKTLDDACALTQKEILLEVGYLLDKFKHCALLAVNTIKKAIENYKENYQHHCQAKDECNNTCDSCTKEECDPSCESNSENKKTENRPPKIKHKIAVLSGKGGVGKSTIAVNLAFALAAAGYKVGLMDADIHGPSIPTLLNLNNITSHSDHEGIIPVEIGNLKVISIGFFLENNTDALIWRGPMKMGIIDRFLHEVKWGELDFLIIDLPPGTGDEPLSIGQSFSNQDGAVIVTTPQEVASADVRKSIDFCHKLGLSILGIIENMSGFMCPNCNDITYIFGSDGGKKLANDFNISLLGEIPLDPTIVSACDRGVCYMDAYADSKTAKVFKQVIASILQRIDAGLNINYSK